LFAAIIEQKSIGEGKSTRKFTAKKDSFLTILGLFQNPML